MLTESAAAAPSGQRTRRRWPALDGMRAVAVLAVLGYHTGVLPGGYLGVDVFFVLSGFLITSLLLDEWDQRGGRISFRDFYARRMLRILPALGCVIAAAAVLAALLYSLGGPGDRPYAIATFEGIPVVIFFAGNWIRALDPSSLIGSLGALGHTWSLAVEEQFYLLWPAFFTIIMRRRFTRQRLAALLAALAVAEMVYRALLPSLLGSPAVGSVYDRIYYGGDTHSDGLLVGCALAFWLSTGKSERRDRILDTLARPATVLASTALILLFIVGTQTNSPVEISAGVLASAVLISAIASDQEPNFVRRSLTAPIVVRIGRLSYGLYLWQYLCLAASEALWASYSGIFPPGLGRNFAFAADIAAGVLASFLMSELSYRFIELPALRRKALFRTALVVSPRLRGDPT